MNILCLPATSINSITCCRCNGRRQSAGQLMADEHLELAFIKSMNPPYGRRFFRFCLAYLVLLSCLQCVLAAADVFRSSVPCTRSHDLTGCIWHSWAVHRCNVLSYGDTEDKRLAGASSCLLGVGTSSLLHLVHSLRYRHRAVGTGL